jgi:hypothetical protein
MHRLNAVLHELRDTRASLSSKIDDSVRDLMNQIRQCESNVAANTARLDTVEQAQATMATQIAALQASMAFAQTAPVPAPTSPAPMPLVMEDLVRELDMRVSRKCNIVLSGVLPSPPLTDAGIVKTLFHNEMGIDVTVVRCSRLGKPSANVNRPCALLVTLSSNVDARTVIRSARKLRNSTDAHVCDHVYFNAST